MRKISLLIFIVSMVSGSLSAQSTTSFDRLLRENPGLVLGGYGEISYKNGFSANQALDVHRFVLVANQHFNERVDFFTEIEFEHVREVSIEQAFLQYSVKPWLRFRGGLMLVPAGIINLVHEPTTFNGVERPLTDKILAPTTWREIGIGVTGTIIGPSLKYEAYLINGLSGYNETPTLSGSGGIRKGRQKGAEAYMRNPDLAARVEYFGIRGLTAGISLYTGRTESSMYEEIDVDNRTELAMADSTTTGITLLGMDFRYERKSLQLRGQGYYINLNDAERYNRFAELRGFSPGLGNKMAGFYLEAAYRFDLTSGESGTAGMIPFIRYTALDTHFSVPESLQEDPANNRLLWTLGLGWKPAKGAVVKADITWSRMGNEHSWNPEFHAGIGVTF